MTASVRRRTAPVVRPASTSQLGVWLTQQVYRRGPANLLVRAFRIDGPLDAEALRAAFLAVVRRHEILRTGFVHDGDDLHQVVAPEAGDWFWSTASRNARDEEPAAYARRLASTPVDLAEPPLLRAHLRAERADRHVLFVLAHRIALDPEALDLVLADVARDYRGAPALLPPPGYAEHVDAERAWLDGDDYRDRFDRVVTALADAPDVLDLPLPDWPGSAPDGATVTAWFDPADVRRLDALAAEAGTDRSAALLAVGAGVLHRWTGQQVVPLGMFASLRDTPNRHAMVGPLDNPVLLPTSWAADPSFRVALDRSAQTLAAALADRQVPFDHVVARAGGRRRPDRSPLFQVRFGVIADQPVSLDLDPLTVTPLVLPPAEPTHDLCLLWTVSGDRVGCVVEHRAETATLAPALAVDAVAAARHAVRHPDAPVSAWPVTAGGADPSVRRRIWTTSAEGAAVVARWQRRLAEHAPAQPVSALFAQTGTGPQRLGSVAVPLPADVGTVLHAWCAAVPERLRGLAVAAAGALLARYGDRTRALVAVPCSAEVVPVPVVLDPEASRADLLEAVTAAVAACRADADALPADATRLVGAAGERSIRVHLDPDDDPPAAAELTVHARLDGDRVVLTLEVDHTRIPPALARRVAAHLAELCTGLARSPHAPVDTLEVVGPAEHEWLTTCPPACALPALPPLPTLFERVMGFADTRPAHTALVFRDRKTSYAQLRQRAFALAELLSGQGVPDTDGVVALLLDRGDLPVVGLLAAFALDARYVPIDTDYPDERVEFMLRDSGAHAVVTQSTLRHRIPGWYAGGVVELDDPHALADLPAPPRRGPEPGSAAYVIYTSGTTGRPKGVLVDHAAYAAIYAGYVPLYGLDADDPVLLQLASISFDGYNGELGRSIYLGGTFVACPPELRADVEGLLSLIEQARISVIESTPALVTPLAEGLAGTTRDVSCVRLLISNSDAWRGADYARVRALVDDRIKVFNTYGTTETIIDSISYPPGDAVPETGYVPIGWPLPYVRTYVLDHRLRPVPAGLVGELCIGGAPMALGYLGRPALTAERFVPDPYGDGDRLYRTGDLARLGPDGAIEFLGRADFQVKVRGHRVELGEVESALRRHPSVREAVVTARPDEGGTQQLVGYVAGDVIDLADLRAFCAVLLPAFMVPSAFVALPALPLTSNGKVDRAALPEVTPARSAVSASFVAPRDDIEERLAGLLGELLKISEIGVDDAFAELGVHSLTTMRLAGGIRATFGTLLPIREIFAADTVAGLASLVRQRSG